MIDKTLTKAYKNDFWLAEICMVSLRYSYPKIRIAVVLIYQKVQLIFRLQKKHYQIEIIGLLIRKFMC